MLTQHCSCSSGPLTIRVKLASVATLALIDKYELTNSTFSYPGSKFNALMTIIEAVAIFNAGG